MSWHLAIRAQLQLCASQQPGLSPCATYTQPDLYGPLALRTPWPLAWTTAMCMDSASGIPIRTTSMVRYSKKGVQCFLDRWRATDSTLEVSLKFGHVSPSLATRVALMRCGLVAAPPPAEQSGGVLLCEGQRLTTDVRRYNTKRQKKRQPGTSTRLPRPSWCRYVIFQFAEVAYPTSGYLHG